MFVAGSAIFGQPDYKTVIDQMRAELEANKTQTITSTKNAALDIELGGCVYCDGIAPLSTSVDKGLKVVNSVYGVRIKSLGTLDMCGFRVRIEDSDFGLNCTSGTVYCNKFVFVSRASGGFAQPGITLLQNSKMFCGDIRITNTIGPVGMSVSGMSCIYTLDGVLNGFNDAGYPKTSVGAGTISATAIGIQLELNSFVDMYLTTITGTSSNGITASKQSEFCAKSPISGGTISIPGPNYQSAIGATRNSTIIFGDAVVDARNTSGSTGFSVQGFSTISCRYPVFGTTNVVPRTLTVNGILSLDVESITTPG